MKALRKFFIESLMTESKKEKRFTKDDIELGDVLIDNDDKVFIYMPQAELERLVDNGKAVSTIGAEFYEEGLYFKPGQSATELWAIINPASFDKNFKQTGRSEYERDYNVATMDKPFKLLVKDVIDFSKLNDYKDLCDAYKKCISKL